MKFISMLALSCALLPPVSHAQSLALQGGTSTLMDSSGGEIHYRWKGVGGFFSMGYQDRLDFGAYAGFRYQGFNFGAGDRTQDFQLGTDNLGANRFFYGRGIFIDRKGEFDSITAFAGVTTNRFGSMFYDAARRLDGTGAIFFKHQEGKNLTFYSANIFQDRVTSLQSVSYRAADRLTLGTTVGVGANNAYAAASADYSLSRFDLSGSYVAAGQGFESVPGVRLLGSERIGANGRAKVKVTETLNLTVEHAKMRTIAEDSENEQPREAVLDTVSAFYRWKDMQFSGAASNSESGSLWTHTYVASASRKLFSESANVSAMFLRQAVAGRSPSNSFIVNGEEKIGPQLTINQGYTRTGSANIISGGARYVSNLLTFGVGQQLYYSPMAGDNKVASIWTFNVNLRVYRAIRLHADSYVSESGRVRYTFWMDGLRFQRSGGDALPEASPQYANVKFGKFMVRGVVVDEAGQPVWGISVRVDGKLAYSDNAGTFTLRFNEGQTYPLSVLVEQSLSPSVYEVVQAPVSVRADTVESAPTIRIVVRKARPQPAPQPAPKRRSATGPEEDETRPGGEALQSFLSPRIALLPGISGSSICFPE